MHKSKLQILKIVFCLGFFLDFSFLFADWYVSLPKNFGRLDKSVEELIDKKITQNMFYPEKAKKRKLAGTVTYDTIIGIDGNLVEIRLANSSGSKILDTSAKTLISSIFPLGISLDWTCFYPINITYKLN